MLIVELMFCFRRSALEGFAWKHLVPEMTFGRTLSCALAFAQGPREAIDYGQSRPS